MQKPVTLTIVLLLVLIQACTEKHLINNKDYRILVENSFNDRKELAKNRESQLFSVFNKSLSTDRVEALKFLYAFMPLNDLADMNGDFFLRNINISLRTKTETTWGKNIPEDIFLHYVLPCRVNNENLDSFRIVFYDEIMNRVRNMDLMDAALEINHWCHEKVSYQPADSRTSAPLSTILSARGRCGEESTLTVAALRTAGIPARQVYTPRWAHSDDNHAWVEIWNSGKWYYLGACEPESVIDRGWFTEPARRAMLIHTKSFGASSDKENSITVHKNYTEVNNLAKYSVTKRIFVKVTDKDGIPLNNSMVEYQLYNYSEFYPLARVPTDQNGISQFETGLGDLLIWAYSGDHFNYRKISVSEIDTLLLKLDKIPGGDSYIDLDLDVPIARSPLPGPSQDLIDSNLKRFNHENIIRQKYIDSWIRRDEVKMLSVKLHADSSRLINIFTRSMGNYNEIRSFLTVTPDSSTTLAISLLEVLADKDLRDTRAVILSDHLANSFRSPELKGAEGEKLFIDYVLNPRIANEMLVAWRGYFRMTLADLIKMSANDPLVIVKYLNENVKIDKEENYYLTPLTPRGVIQLKVSDPDSRAISFVAICRSFGIPSRLEPGSNVPQYFLNSAWHDVFFSDQKQPDRKKGYIRLISAESKPVPEYYIHFTLARFENGRYNTLEYDYNKKITDFREELELAPGSYMLVTGNRLNDTKILSGIRFFDLAENEHKTIEVKIRKDTSPHPVSGTVDLNRIISLLDQHDIKAERIAEKGVVIMWINPGNEPGKHIINDLPHLKKELDSWGGYFIVLSDPSAEWKGFTEDELSLLPANMLFGHDKLLLNGALKPTDASGDKLPYIIMAGKKGEIFYSSSGYRIGIGEQLLRNTR